jgi:hypothetical protein
LKRLQKQTAADGTVTYVNQNNAHEVWEEDDYDTCNYNSVTAATAARVATMATTNLLLGTADYAVVQICPWYLQEVCYLYTPALILFLQVNMAGEYPA